MIPRFKLWLFATLTSAGLLGAAIAQDSGIHQGPIPTRIECRAQYVQLTPYELVGMDECGHIWKLILPRGMRPKANSEDVKRRSEPLMGENETDDVICTFFDPETGEFRQIECPKPGQVTGYIELGEGEKQ